MHCILSVKSYCLFLGGHTLRLTPPGIELYIFAIDFHILIGAYPHIIFLLGGQFTYRLRSGLIFAYRYGLIALFEVRRCAILHFIAFSLGSLLFPGDLKAFLGRRDLGHTGALGIDGKGFGHGAKSGVLFLKLHLNCVLAYILATAGISHIVVRAGNFLPSAVLHGNRRLFHLTVIGIRGSRQGQRLGLIEI